MSERNMRRYTQGKYSICPGKSFGPNGIRHPHWVKIYGETNGPNNLRAKHTKFFLLQIQDLLVPGTKIVWRQ